MINFTYTKLSNQFFFISNLADWHYSCRKYYNDEWLKDNPLNKEEKQAIEKIKPVLCKHGPKYFGEIFFQDSKQWDYLSKMVTKTEYEKFQDIFNVFQEKFDKIWEIEEKKLKKWKEILENSEAIKSKEIIKDIKKFLSSRANPKIKTYLLINPCVDRGPKGGANEGKNKISLEVSNKEQKDLPKVLSVLFHEVAHVYQRDCANFFMQEYIEKNNLQEKYKKIRPDLLKQKFGICSLFSETIVSSLFNSYWRGALTEKYFKNGSYEKPESIKSFETMDDVLGYSIYMAKPKIKEYLENNKKIDEELLDFIWENFEKVNLGK